MAPHTSPPFAGSERIPEPSDLLNVRTVHDCSGAVVTVRGEVDLYSAGLLQEALHQAIEDTAPHGGSVVIDLTDVTFMASSGLSVLLAGLDQANGRQCELRLAGGGRAVQRPLQASGLEAHFQHHPSVAAARQAVRARKAPSTGRS